MEDCTHWVCAIPIIAAIFLTRACSLSLPPPLSLFHCHHNHTCAWLSGHPACADSGQVFSFGVNKFGELGLGHDKETTKPVLIPELQSAYRVACGRHHSAAIDGELSPVGFQCLVMLVVVLGCNAEDGVLWMWGWGGRGQLGNSTMKSQFQPAAPEGFK